MTIRVSQLWRFPVKSLAGDRHPALPLDGRGLAGDRAWMVVDARGRFVTQRQVPAMTRIQAVYDGNDLSLRHLDRPQPELRLPQAPQGRTVEVTVWRDQCEAVDAGDEAAAWLSGLLGKPLRLCFLPPTFRRQVDVNFAKAGDEVGFADGFPLLVCNQASIDYLSRVGGRPLAPQRFRPNIVVDGAELFAENHWRRLRIGEVELDLVKPCARCVIPSLDPGTAEQQPAVLELLRAHCRGADGQIYFGQNAIHRQCGRLEEGAEVKVLD